MVGRSYKILNWGASIVRRAQPNGERILAELTANFKGAGYGMGNTYILHLGPDRSLRDQGRRQTMNKIKPMLAKVYDPNKTLPYPVYLQPKLDGSRCLAYMIDGKVECWSSPSHALPEGKRYETTWHIERELTPHMHNGDIFDGELCKHGDTRDIEYHIYDAVRPGNTMERIDYIEQTLPFHHICFVVPVKTVQADSPEEMLTLIDIFISQGYQGSIIRTRLGKYEQGKRSSHLLKVKKFYTLNF